MHHYWKSLAHRLKWLEGVVLETKEKFESLSMNQIKQYYMYMQVLEFDIDDEVLGIKRLSVVLKNLHIKGV